MLYMYGTINVNINYAQRTYIRYVEGKLHNTIIIKLISKIQLLYLSVHVPLPLYANIVHI